MILKLDKYLRYYSIKMVDFFYLREDESGQNLSIIIVRAGTHDTICVQYGYLPIPFDSEEHLDLLFGKFHNVQIDDEDDKRKIYVLIHMDNLYQKLMDSDTLPNIDLALNILEHSNKEGWVWNINKFRFDELPKPDGHCHSWVHHTQSWETECVNCFKPKCPSVEILSEEIWIKSLERSYCDCEKCEHCDFIYDDECKCRASTQKQSDASSNSHFVRCEDCCRMYDAWDKTSLYIHDGRCC
jgi:hypothetical protein